MSYNPSLFTASNKSYGVIGPIPDSARSWYQNPDFSMRPFMGLDEVKAYFDTPFKRMGKFTILVNEGGTLSNGSIVGGTYKEYWWRDGAADNQLVAKTQDGQSVDVMSIKDPRFGAKGDTNLSTFAGTDDTASFEAAIASVSVPVTKVANGGLDPVTGKLNFFNYPESPAITYISVPTGNYKITRNILLHPNVRFVAQSSGVNFIASGVTGDLFSTANLEYATGNVLSNTLIPRTDLESGAVSYVPGVEFERITFLVDTTKPAIPTSFIKLAGSTNASIKNCKAFGSRLGFVVNSCVAPTILNNLVEASVGGIALFGNSAGAVKYNQFTGYRMPVFGSHTDNVVAYGFASNVASWFAGKCFGIYQYDNNLDVSLNAVYDGMYYGFVSESTGGTIDNNAVKGIATGGAAYSHKNSPYLKYNIGELNLASGVKLFSFQDSAISEVKFTNNRCVFNTFGDVPVGSSVEVYQFKNPSVAIPDGVKLMDSWKTILSGDIRSALAYINLPKNIALSADSTISADVNVSGDSLKISNGKASVASKLVPSGRIFAYTPDILFKGISIVNNSNGFISPVSGQYKIVFDSCDINLTSGPLLTNNAATAGQINSITLVLKNCNVHADSAMDLVGSLDPQYARLDIRIQLEGNTTLTNVYIPANSTAFRLISIDGSKNYPSLSDRGSSHSYGGGKMIYKDPTFKDGTNGIVSYNTLVNGNVTVARVTADALPIASPSDSGYILRVTNNGAAAPDSGGFSFQLDSRPNSVFIARFIAVLPKGAIVSCNASQFGDGGYIFEGTPQIGTGKWEEYRFTIKCGAAGSFGKIANFSVKGADGQSFYLGYATVYDMAADPVDLEFTASDKTKLDSLENHFRGTYLTLAALQEAHATGVEGDYAIVDTASEDPIQYIWSTSGSNWVPGSVIVGGTGGITTVNGQQGPIVNITKESLGLTNDYTTAEKNKVAGVSPGATANSTDSALRDRATHTGSQAIGTVTGLQTALDSKVPTEAGKGLSTNDYSNADKAKVATFPADGSTLLPKAGGTLTGTLTWASSLLAAVGGALNLKNSDILGINAMFFADETDSDNEGLRFPKAGGTVDPTNSSLWDTLRAYRGELLWSGLLGITSIGDVKAPNLVNTPIEVNVAGTLVDGKISGDNGAFNGDTNFEMTGFLPVSVGDRVRVTFSTGEYTSTAPIVGTGVVGYSSAAYSAYVTTFASATTYNVANGTNLVDPVVFIDNEFTITSGVTHIKVPNLKGSGVTLKVMMLKNTGTIKDSINQLYQRISSVLAVANTGGGGASGGSGNFTQEYKDKLDQITLPVASFDNNGIIFTDRTTGDRYRALVDNGQWILEALATSLRSFTEYPVGFAIDWDKYTSSATYSAAVQDGGITTPENAMLPAHLNPGLAAGFTQFVPGANSLSWNYTEADALCDFAVSKGIKVHANHLTWHADGAIAAHVKAIATNNPGNEKAKLSEYLKEYIPAVMNHFDVKYPGLVISWNVMNEAVWAAGHDGHTGGSAKESLWATWFTLDEFFELTFTAARKANPNCKLFFNDFDLETSNSSQADTYMNCINNLAAKNIMVGTPAVQVKVDGVGFQFHTVVGQDLNAARTKMKRFADAGLLLCLTELDATITGTTYTPAMAQTQAQFFYDIFVNYERAVPKSLRWGVMFWTVTDRYYIKNAGKSAPGTTGGITIFAAIYDWFGAKKPAYDKLLTIPGRSASSADVYQDFIATGTLASITGTLTGGRTPLVWLEEGYTGGDVGINATGLRAAQTSQNSYTFELVDYPNPNRTVTARLAVIKSAGTRTCLILGRYIDASNYIAAEADNTTNCWIIRKRIGGVNSVLFTSDATCTNTDEVSITCSGTTHTLTVNGVIKGSVTDPDMTASTKAGFKMRGYDDKFTTYETFSVNKVS